MFAQNWIVGVDFNYYNFDFDRSVVLTSGVTSNFNSTNSNIYVVTARLSYLFNLGR